MALCPSMLLNRVCNWIQVSFGSFLILMAQPLFFNIQHLAISHFIAGLEMQFFFSSGLRNKSIHLYFFYDIACILATHLRVRFA